MADPDGLAKEVCLQPIQEDMANAWSRNPHQISQVIRNIFLVKFRSLSDMRFVWTRQPWHVGRDNLLLEWVDPHKELP